MFTFELLNVDKSYGGRGIASLLVELSINVAKEQGFKLLLVETTGKLIFHLILCFFSTPRVTVGVINPCHNF